MTISSLTETTARDTWIDPPRAFDTTMSTDSVAMLERTMRGGSRLSPRTRRVLGIALGAALAAALVPLFSLWLGATMAGLRAAFVAVAAALLAGVITAVVRRPRREDEAAANETFRLGPYELLERIDAGGMGEIWRARHETLQRTAAVKFIRRDMLDERSPEELERLERRFEREAKVTASLHSPHTVHLYDFGRTSDGQLFYAMELLDGIGLDTLVDRFGPQPAARVVRILRQVCHSIAEAHARGLLHRDIKPANIRLTHGAAGSDIAKLIDFGLVRQLGAPRDSLASPDGLVGTAGYLAPEVIVRGGSDDPRVDLYALGCVAYFLVTGRRVFSGSTRQDVMRAHLALRPVPPRARVGEAISREFESLILSLLAKDPDDRPRDAVELAAKLASLPEAVSWTEQRAQWWWRIHGEVAVMRLDPSLDQHRVEDTAGDLDHAADEAETDTMPRERTRPDAGGSSPHLLTVRRRRSRELRRA